MAKKCPVACTACRYCIEHCLGCPNCACKPCKDDVALLGDAHPIKHRVVA